MTALCDRGEEVARRYLGPGAPAGLAVTDRWQALRERAVGEVPALPSPEDVLSLLGAIESECPECAPVDPGWGEAQ